MRSKHTVVTGFHHQGLADLTLDRESEIVELRRTCRFLALEPRDTVFVGERRADERWNRVGREPLVECEAWSDAARRLRRGIGLRETALVGGSADRHDGAERTGVRSTDNRLLVQRI